MTLAGLTGPQGRTEGWESRPGTRTQEPRSPLQPQPFPDDAAGGLDMTQSLTSSSAASLQTGEGHGAVSAHGCPLSPAVSP